MTLSFTTIMAVVLLLAAAGALSVVYWSYSVELSPVEGNRRSSVVQALERLQKRILSSLETGLVLLEETRGRGTSDSVERAIVPLLKEADLVYDITGFLLSSVQRTGTGDDSAEAVFKLFEELHKVLRGTSEPTPTESSESSTEDVADELSETSNEVPRAAEGTLGAVAAGIKQSIAEMSRWSMADLTLGLYKLSARHALEGAADTIDGTRVTSGDELQELTRWFRYNKNKEKLAIEIEIDETQVIKRVFTSGVLKPAYFIAVDNARRCVVMSIRGTLAATDVLTDLNPHSEKFEGGFAHSGMLAAARWLMENEAVTLRELLTSNPNIGLFLSDTLLELELPLYSVCYCETTTVDV